jgi:hypothetical protein
MKQHSTIPFRWALPIAQFILCAILLWPFRSGYFIQVHNALHAYWPELVDREEIAIHSSVPNHANESPARSYGEWRLVAPALLNMPVVLTGLARRETVPMGIVSEWWRALTWPIAGLIFWWMAGRGIEALLATRSHLILPALTWPETIVALLVSVSMGIILVGIVVDPSIRSESIFPWRMELEACSLWLILALTTVVARVLQWRLKAGIRSDSAAPTVQP